MTFWKNLLTVLIGGYSDPEIIAGVRKSMSQRPQLKADAFAEAYFPEEKQRVARKLWEITKEHSVADITGMVAEDRFAEDLKMDDLDSMSLVELTLHLEGDFGIDIPDARLKEIRTFSELVDEICLRQKMKPKAASA